MYPDYGTVRQGYSLQCVPALVLHSDWSCLAWAVFCRPMCQAVSNPKTEDGGLLLPLKSMDWVILAFWDWVEYPLDDRFASVICLLPNL